jgi:uncharacterized membrane protein
VRKALTAAVALATVVYPFAVYWSLGRIGPAWIAFALVALALLRAWATRQAFWLAAAAGAAVLGAASLLVNAWLPLNGNAWLPLKLYPVLVNAVLLAVFATSLRHPPSAIERLARLAEPDLPPAGVAYTRRVTQVWCGFFGLNGTLALLTAVAASDETWALYNGLVAYLLMAALFGAEWLVRQRVKAGAAHG